MSARLVSGLVLGAIAIAAVWLGGWPAAILMGAVSGIVCWEWARLTGAGPALPVAFGVAVGVTVAMAWAFLLPAAIAGIALAVGGAALSGAWLAAGVVYAMALGLALVVLRADPALGLAAVAFVLAVVWASDTAAFLVGRRVGGPRLWPAVSPGKTWSGLVGGTIGGTVAGVAAAAIAGVAVRPGLAAVALVLSLLSAGGDLFESAIKRRFGVKDASNLIPGHGGMMDRVDGLAFAAIAAAAIGLARGGADAIGLGLLAW